MGPLAAVERFLERLFERGTARLFRTTVRPVQVQRRLERAMEANRLRDGGRTVVPHRFVVRLSTPDLAAADASMNDLAGSLANGALAFARSHGYTLLDRPVVTLRPDPAVGSGDIAIDVADPYLGETEARGEMGSRGRSDGAAVAGDDDDGAVRRSSQADANPSFAPQHTAVFVVPGVEGPLATIREIRPDGSARTIEFDGRPITIGRAPDNGLVVRDGRASRHHARIDSRRGSLVLTDLGSTNGSFVNDRRVDSVALGEGDRIRIGTTTLLVDGLHADASAGLPDQLERDDPAPRSARTSDASGGNAAVPDIVDR